MKKSLAYLAVGFLALGLSFSACKKGATIGTVGEKDNNPFPVFDTFAIPKNPYFFWGVFNGHFMKWVHNERSDWDTITRWPSATQDPTVDPWSSWPVYSANLYQNVTNQGILGACSEYPDDDFVKFESRFIRTEFPEQRITLNFYRCANLIDTFTSAHWFADTVSILTEGAWPFSNLERGEWGAEVIYTDENRDRWITQSGSGNAQDSYLRITNLYPRNNPDTTDTFAHFVLEGEFAGRLFKEKDPTTNIAVTNSKFRTRIIAIRPLGFDN